MPDTKKENDFDEDEVTRRFERAVDIALHTPPMRKPKKIKKPKDKAKKEKPAD